MSVDYTKVNWKNSPSTQTPLNATNLNKMDTAIDDVANWINQNEDKVGDESGLIAAPFSTTKAYSKGDLVVHEKQLYAAKNNVAAGAWNASSFETVTVSAKLAELKAAIDAIEPGGGGDEPQEETLLFSCLDPANTSAANPAASPMVPATFIENCTITKITISVNTAGVMSFCGYPKDGMASAAVFNQNDIVVYGTHTFDTTGNQLVEFDTPIVVPEGYVFGIGINTDTAKASTGENGADVGSGCFYFSRTGSYAGMIRTSAKSVSMDVYGYSNAARPAVESVFKGKKVSIFGDSISTFSGWLPSGNRTYYTGSNSGVSVVEDTWWMKVINALGMTLLVNNSYSGRAVSSIRDQDQYHTDDAGYRESTVIKCQSGSTLPDIIIIKLGINDFNREALLGNYDGTTAVPTDPSTFANAYAMMLNLVMTHYPLARVYCCTLMASEWMNGGTGFPEINDNGDSVESWNEMIRKIAGVFGAEVLDHARCGLTYFNIPTYMGDYDSTTEQGIHPNAAGHSLIANQTIHDMDNAVRIRY